MKYIIGFIAIVIALNIYANPCNDQIKIVKSDNDTFNRLQQQNVEQAALVCQQYQIYKEEKTIEYLDKQIREHNYIP